MRAEGFPPVARRDARVLILGTLPSVRSLEAWEYYAHPRNAFWRIVEDLFEIPRDRPYRERTAGLTRRRVALWDVLEASRRQGSLDAAIDTTDAAVNDFAGFFRAHPGIRLLCFNGRKAEDLFLRLAAPALEVELPQTLRLPSTSPAHAAMPYAEKLRRWSVVLGVR